ncbi:MAG: hypothetical protein IT176_01385 [Acidobacteria bacterium]|nr:hypothetical protein [Acidobacteriota bacterium]
MAQAPQTFRNHRRVFPPYHFVLLPILIVNFSLAARGLARDASLAALWSLIMAAALIMIALFARVGALRAQDRVIRLEMRLRLREVLPPDLQPRIDELTTGQLIGLRFASDAELPELTREVLAGALATAGAIKARVKHWQEDRLRV